MCLEKSVPKGFELSVAGKNFWPADKKALRVHFIGGTERMRAQVEKCAKAWHPFVNVRFEFVDDPQAEIRVAFKPDGSSWSALGTDALNEIPCVRG